jgi:STE24 endopeptidase
MTETPSIHPLLDPEKQQQARRYEKEKRLLGLLGGVISTLFLLGFYFSGLSHRLAHTLPDRNFVFPFLLYITTLITLSTLIGLPLNFYQSYIHEHRWGFSNYTLKTWLLDQGKAFLVALVLTPLLIGLLLSVMTYSPRWWWLIAGLGTALVGVVFVTLFPVLILPIFNRYDPIENPELTTRLTRILERVGLKPSGFFKQDMSRQTKKENAFLAGLGKTRRVILGDNLLDQMNPDEIETIIAHEVGHYRYGHLWKNLFIGTGQQLVIFFLLDRVLTAVFPHFLDSTRWNLALLPMFLLGMNLLSAVLFGPLNLALSRFFERQADRTALELAPNRQAFQSALAGLANRNLVNAYPARWIKVLFYSHPPIGERLALAESYPATPDHTPAADPKPNTDSENILT